MVKTNFSLSNIQMWYDSFNLFLGKIRENIQITKELLKTEMNHDEITADNYKDRKDIWVDLVKNDV